MRYLIVICFMLSSAKAEDLNEIFKRVNDYTTQKKYTKALEELGWARKEIEKLHTDQLRAYFPDELAGYKGDKMESNSMLGLTNLERNYVKDNSSVKVSLSGGSGGAAGGFGNLAALGKMAAMMGGQPGSETIRIGGHTATMATSEGNNAELTVYLDSGSVLSLQGADAETLKKMAEALKLSDLDTYLKG